MNQTGENGKKKNIYIFWVRFWPAWPKFGTPKKFSLVLPLLDV